MNQKILKHFRQYGMFTYPGLYESYIKEQLPDEIEKIGLLVRKSLIHRTTLRDGNTKTNTDLRFGDMTRVPWWRQPEDDNLLTATAMLAELFRRDKRGLTLVRKPEDKLVLTCRYTAVLMASILKSKGIPCRVRSGHANYFTAAGKMSYDHWINQYWDKKQRRWITIDVDGSLSIAKEGIDPYDIKDGEFDFPAEVWLAIRSGKENQKRFWNAGGVVGMITVLWALFYDFYSIMNNEIHYMHGPVFSHPKRFKRMTEKELKKIDRLARLMLDPDQNFEKLYHLYETDRELRLLVGGLL